jgi:hypothetical protein
MLGQECPLHSASHHKACTAHPSTPSIIIDIGCTRHVMGSPLHHLCVRRRVIPLCSLITADGWEIKSTIAADLEATYLHEVSRSLSPSLMSPWWTVSILSSLCQHSPLKVTCLLPSIRMNVISIMSHHWSGRSLSSIDFICWSFKLSNLSSPHRQHIPLLTFTVLSDILASSP